MKTIGDKITGLIEDSLKGLDLPQVKFVVEHPADELHGDYSSNVALEIMAEGRGQRAESRKVDYKTAREVAEAIAENLRAGSEKLTVFEKIKVAGPGFVNIWLKNDYLVSQLERVIEKGDRYGRSDNVGKKVMVEFTDPNPFKEFHIGHLYSNIVGESLARLFEARGAEVKRANYQGDVGLHVAKAIYGLIKEKDLEGKLKELDKKSKADRAEFLGKAYTVGANAYEEDEEAKKKIEGLNEKIYKLDPEVKELYEKGRQWSLDYFETIYERLGTKFDFYYFEREAGRVGLEVVKDGLSKGVFQESDGAVIFKGDEHGLHTRVFINSQGLPTYEAKDLGLVPTKYKDFAYDQSVIVTGNEVVEYFKVVFKALSLLNPELVKKTRHVSHGMVKLPTGKMSSRTGEILTGEWLLNEAKKRSQQKIQGSTKIDSKATEAGVLAEIVGQGAIKYALLKQGIGRDIAFDFEESVNFEGNSGPYLQYTFVRTQSVLGKDEALSVKNESSLQRGSLQAGEVNDEERSILRWLYRYPEVVKVASEELSPHNICSYLYELAQRFNTFYSKHRIIQAKKDDVKEFRLMLTDAVGQVVKNGLRLLGITAPSKM